ncbi:hypothetical protein RUM44_012913 [Polyplax serrata]|uniref:Set2 Rpb1 interacting domain-containing protein n=1 Tax=Polyplax serrata TaxID=468196 RepID=A0ABR1BGD1_POLSC
MPLKKTKKRRVKCKRSIRLCKSQRVKIERMSSMESEKTITGHKHFWNKIKWGDPSDCTGIRYCSNENEGPRIKKFAKMREYYFAHLQNVVSENCHICNSAPNINVLKNLSLELEQKALLASLQSDIYVEAITKIIFDIQKCTRERQVHNEVKNLLPKVYSCQYPSDDVRESNVYFSPTPATCTQTPSPVLQSDLIYSNQEDEEEANQYSDIISDELSEKNSVCYSHKANPLLSNIDGSTTTRFNIINGNISKPQNNENLIISDISVNIQDSCTLPILQDSNGTKECINSVSQDPQQIDKHSVKLYLNKVENETVNDIENISKQEIEDKERDYILQVLEYDEDCFPEKCNFFKENINETKENFSEINLMNKLEKMREIFGPDNCKNITNKENNKLNKPHINIGKSTIWKHERIIQQCKLSILSSEMSSGRQIINKRLFVKLFGEDSDSEHELEYRSYDKYKTSCVERISSWVVKYLMPYYHAKRIIGREIFKSLGHHISNRIIRKIHYPDELTVKHLVSKFFTNHKTYASDSDVFSVECI